MRRCSRRSTKGGEGEPVIFREDARKQAPRALGGRRPRGWVGRQVQGVAIWRDGGAYCEPAGPARMTRPPWRSARLPRRLLRVLSRHARACRMGMLRKGWLRRSAQVSTGEVVRKNRPKQKGQGGSQDDSSAPQASTALQAIPACLVAALLLALLVRSKAPSPTCKHQDSTAGDTNPTVRAQGRPWASGSQCAAESPALSQIWPVSRMLLLSWTTK